MNLVHLLKTPCIVISVYVRASVEKKSMTMTAAAATSATAATAAFAVVAVAWSLARQAFSLDVYVILFDPVSVPTAVYCQMNIISNVVHYLEYPRNVPFSSFYNHQHTDHSITTMIRRRHFNVRN